MEQLKNSNGASMICLKALGFLVFDSLFDRTQSFCASKDSFPIYITCSTSILHDSLIGPTLPLSSWCNTVYRMLPFNYWRSSSSLVVRQPSETLSSLSACAFSVVRVGSGSIVLSVEISQWGFVAGILYVCSSEDCYYSQMENSSNRFVSHGAGGYLLCINSHSKM